MNFDLMNLLNEKITAQSPGIFSLNFGVISVEIEFDGISLHAPENPPFRWFPTSQKLYSILEPQQLEKFLGHWYSKEFNLDESLQDFPIINEKDRQQISAEHRCSDLSEYFLLSQETVIFEPATVKTTKSTVAIPAVDFLAHVEQLFRNCKKTDETLPAFTELLVLSPRGVAARDENESWIFSRIALLIDGFRTIEEIIHDSPFSPAKTRQQLARGAENGWVFKTNFPELDAISSEKLPEEQHKEIVNQLEIAIKMAADPLTVLEKLNQFHKTNRSTEAVIATQIRIAEANQLARNSAAAIQILEDLLKLHPERLDVKESQIKIIIHHGEELLRSSQPEEGRRYLRRAIELSDDDQIRLLLIASHQDQTSQIREAIKTASLLFRNSKKERALRLIDSLEALYPENIEMQRARIDFLLDLGEEQASEIALERLAAQLANEGNLQEARAVAESIRRLRHKRRSLSHESHRGTRALKNIRLLVLLLPFFILTLFVIETEFAIQKVIAKAELMTPESWRKEASPWLRWLPSGPWKTGLENAATLVEERSIDSQRTYSTAAKEALQNAKNSRLLGKGQDLAAHLQQATKFGAGAEVKQLTQKWQQEDQQAKDLRQLIITSRNQGDLSATRRWTMEILEKFPANDASVGLSIPVKIKSKPGTFLIDDSDQAVSLPTWIEVEPFGSKKVILENEGRRSEFVITTQSSETVTLPAP
ncbi:MAG: hypothetical protein AAEJ04_06155 [Planctomycetota bacterium]